MEFRIELVVAARVVLVRVLGFDSRTAMTMAAGCVAVKGDDDDYDGSLSGLIFSTFWMSWTSLSRNLAESTSEMYKPTISMNMVTLHQNGLCAEYNQSVTRLCENRKLEIAYIKHTTIV